MEPHCSCHVVRSPIYCWMLTSLSCLFQPLLCFMHVCLPIWIVQNVLKKQPPTLQSTSPHWNPFILYPIIRAKRIPTKYGHTVVLTLRVSETSIVQVFLPKRYSEVMSDTNMDSINSKAVSLHLVYREFVNPPSPTC